MAHPGVENQSELVIPWPLTRDSLHTDSVTEYRANIAILRYFETLTSNSVVLYRRINSSPGADVILAQLMQQDTMPIAALERLLSLALKPHHLCAFDDERILPACMKLLETYCMDNRLFSGAYGYLCIRILLIAFQVNVLVEYADFDEFLAEQYCMPAHDQLLSLSEHAAGLLRANLSDWAIERSVKDFVIPTPGLSIEHIGFLYRHLSGQRRVLTAARVLYPERFHGWSTLFYLMFIMLHRTGHLGCSNSPPNHDYDCPREIFQDLLNRFWLAKSTIKEETLLDEIYWMASESKGRRGIESDDSVPFYKEALFLWKAYALRIVRTAGVETFDMESSSSLFQWMAFGFWYHTLPVMPVVLETSLIRISEGCQDDDEVVWALTEFTGRIFGFTQCVLSDQNVSAYHGAQIAEVFLRADLVNLIGSVLLLAMKAANLDIEYAFLSTDDSSFLEHWSRTRCLLRCFITTLLESYEPARPRLLEPLPDWIRIARHIENAIGEHKHDSDLRGHLIECREEWFWLGEVLQIEDHWTKDLDVCANPRCADPRPFYGTHIVCGRCSVTRYCSPRCQEAHWSSHKQHKAECWGSSS